MNSPDDKQGKTRPVDQQCPLSRRIGGTWYCLTSVDACALTPLPFGCDDVCRRRDNVLDQLNMRHIYNVQKIRAADWEDEA